ncbi:hypothetical protein [Mycobacterium sp.]|uniref:hypothetical protein n=1 Tax=Mycobacterium sp. TaxID=1785 RepID=UPI002C187053|nr:hypothetical protein [Mycobacterium sp.]HKP40400.1 hypothetical protein [Mycobacterium sp.]
MRASIDEGPTSPQSPAATASDARAAAGALGPAGLRPTVAHRRFSAQAAVGGGVFVVLLIALAVSVIWVSDDSKHPRTQMNPSQPASTSAPAPSPTLAGPMPLPSTTTQQPRPVDTTAAPTEAMSPSQVTAETMTPPPPRHPLLHELFPHLFPGG